MRPTDALYSCRSVLKELVDLLNQDRSPLCNSRPQPLLSPDIQRHLTHFSLVTHGFGAPAIVSAMQAVTSWLNEMLKGIDRHASRMGVDGEQMDYLPSQPLPTNAGLLAMHHAANIKHEK